MVGEWRTASGLRYQRRGSGRAIIFVHGWCLNRQLWNYAEAAFVEDYDVITPDLPGFGASADLAGPYSLERFSAEICQLLDELALEKAVLVGFALGAAVALHAAAKDASRIAGVVSVAIPSASALPYEKMPKAMKRDWPAFARKSAEVLFANPQSEATIGWIERMFCASGLAVAIETAGVLARLQPEALAKAAPVRQLFLHSPVDTVAPVDLGKQCLAAAAEAALEIIDNSGHLIAIDNRDAFHDRLRAFLDCLDV
jgi:pimeloyl-ACP methyl ester carboxylesterase